jgi:hypothetical protein
MEFQTLSTRQIAEPFETTENILEERGQIKWVTLGDASTKFFHANATIKFRRNLITCLETNAEVSVFYHQHKADMIWEAFKDRLGVSKFTAIHF